MQTPWGELPVSDAHVHFFSHGFFSLLGKQKSLAVDAMGPLLGWEMPDVDPVALARRWVRELDTHGVSRAAIIASLPGDEGSVAAAVAAFPERFHGYSIVNPTAPLPENEHLRVPCFFPAMHRYSMQDPMVDAILQRLASQPKPVVFVHCGVLSVGVRKKLGLASPFDMRFSNPIELHGVALRYPQLRFVVPHFGAGYFREALMLSDLCPNVYLDTSSSNGWMRYENLTLEEVFRRALNVVGPRRLLFGTDSSFFPRGWNAAVFEAQAAALGSLGINEADARAIFGGNLEELLAP